MKLRNDRVGVYTGYLDFGTNQELKITKSVDITDECPRKALLREDVILDFGQGTPGVFVKIVCRFSGEHKSVEVFKYLDQLDNLEGPDVPLFSALSEMFGLTVEQLILLIRREAPPKDRSKFLEDFKRYSLAPDSQFDELLKKSGLTAADLNE